MSQFQIVEASLEDAHAIGAIQTQTWLTNYPNADEGITREDIAEKIKQWEKEGDERIRSQMQKPHTHTWVGKQGEDVVGFIAVLKKEDEHSIEALHILPQFQGQGLGTKLLETALEWLGTEKKISIEVVSYNTGAQKLYEKFGFAKVEGSEGECITLPSGISIPKIIMRKYNLI